VKLEFATPLTDVHLDFDCLLNAVIVLKKDFTILSVNNPAALMLGISQRRLKDKDLFEVVKFEEPAVSTPSGLLEDLNGGYFSARLTGPSGGIQAFVQLVSTPANPDLYLLLLYDEAVETELARKYKDQLGQKDRAIAALHRTQDLLKENLSNLKFIAFAFTYTINGFVALGLKYSVATIPAMLNVGSRLTVAGIVLYWFFAHFKKRKYDWSYLPLTLTNAVIGRAVGLGAMAYATHYLSSGVVSVFYGSTPVGLALWTWMINKKAPAKWELMGLAVGFTGLMFLAIHQASSISPVGVGLALLALMCMSLGLFFSAQQKEPMISLAIEQVIGGLLLMGMSVGFGEKFDFSQTSEVSILAYLFLLVFGTIAMQPAGRWLLQVSTPAQGSSFYYATPIIGLAAGALLAKEHVSGWDIAATVLVITAIVLIFKDRAEAQRKSDR